MNFFQNRFLSIESVLNIIGSYSFFEHNDRQLGIFVNPY